MSDRNTMIRWERMKGRFSNGEAAWLGMWPVGSAYWDPEPGTGNKWVATSALPGLKVLLGRYESIDDAKAKVASVTAKWVAAARLQAKE